MAVGEAYRFTTIGVISLVTRLEALASAEYWIHFMVRSDGVHAFGFNSAESEPIWMKFGVLCRWSWQILGAIRLEATARERDEILFCCPVNNASTLPISDRPNATKRRGSVRR